MIITKANTNPVVTVDERIERDHPTVAGAKVLVAAPGVKMLLSDALRLEVDLGKLIPVGPTAEQALAQLRGDTGADGGQPDGWLQWLASVKGVGVATADAIAATVDRATVTAALGDVTDPTSVGDDERAAAVALLEPVKGVSAQLAETIVDELLVALVDDGE